MWKKINVKNKKFNLIFILIQLSEKHGREGLTIQASNKVFAQYLLDKSCKWKPSLKMVEALSIVLHKF